MRIRTAKRMRDRRAQREFMLKRLSLLKPHGMKWRYASRLFRAAMLFSRAYARQQGSHGGRP